MIIVSSYSIAILFCILAMICWGSWANTQKMAARTWRFELFYWDLVIGILLMGLISAFTVGSLGTHGRTFSQDIAQADTQSMIYAALGGILWNIGNLLLVAAIAVAGLAVAFPIGGGIAWILGIVINYFIVVAGGGVPSQQPVLLWVGVAIIVTAIVFSGKAYDKLSRQTQKASAKGILLSVIAGLFIAFFYGFVVKSLDPAFVSGGTGKLTPYTAIVFFTVGVLVSTLIINPIFMARPVEGEPVKMKAYFSGTSREHFSGILGGMIWCLGMVVSFMAAGAANPAISYALSNAAPVVAILWGLFIWKEFKGAPRGTNLILSLMFVFYVVGLVLVTFSNA